MTIRIWPMTLGMLLCACAASPQKPPVAVAASGVATTSQKPAVPNYERAEFDRRAREMGYRVETRNSERKYCQYSAPVGSHIAQMHCLSPDLLAEAMREDDEVKDKLSQRNSSLCPGCPMGK